MADLVVLTRPHWLQKELGHLVHLQASAVSHPIEACGLGSSVPPWELPLWNPVFQHAVLTAATCSSPPTCNRAFSSHPIEKFFARGFRELTSLDKRPWCFLYEIPSNIIKINCSKSELHFLLGEGSWAFPAHLGAVLHAGVPVPQHLPPHCNRLMLPISLHKVETRSIPPASLEALLSPPFSMKRR